jgi:DNA polymerase-3 subunit gamma/tau
MSYIVLARKWRPQNFDDLIGQETVARTIKNALSSEKIVHAYLFSGPRGVGKTSAARILAKALNCSQGPATEPCGKCRNCLSISGGSSIDVLEIDGASNNSVDDVRELRESVKYAPSACKYKVYIIDEVHMLSKEAFNALLKTLEEPPPHVIFIFATTEPKKVPSTILSRCQHHAFRRIPKAKIKERLIKITQSENIKIKEMAIEMITRAADGSMRDALTILDQASSFSDDISERELQILLGLPETDVILNLSEPILSGDISKSLSIIKELAETGYDFRSIIKELVDHFRNIAIVKIVQSPDQFLDLAQEELQKLQRHAAQANIEELTLLLTELIKLESEVRSSINPRYSLELGLLRTSFIKGMPSISAIFKKLGGYEQDSTDAHKTKEHTHLKKAALPENKSNSACSPRSEADRLVCDSSTTHRVEQAVPDTNPALTEIRGSDAVWLETIEKVKAKDPLLACKLAEAKVTGITSKELTIGFNGGMSVFADSVKKNAALVEQTVSDVTGNKLRLKIVSLPEEKKGINKIKEEIFSNPTVKNAMELFNGTLLEVKPLRNTDNHN